MPEARCRRLRHAPATAAPQSQASSDPLPDNDPQPPPATRPETPPPHRCSNATRKPAADPPPPPARSPPSRRSHAPPDKAQVDLQPSARSPQLAASPTHTAASSVTETEKPPSYPQTSPATLRPHCPPADIPDSQSRFPSPPKPRKDAPCNPNRISL